MSRYRLTSKAVADLSEIWSYIARDNVAAADRVETAIYSACSFIAEHPFSGHVRRDLTSLPVRFWSIVRFPSYVIVYDPKGEPTDIIRILHRAMNIARQLQGPMQSS